MGTARQLGDLREQPRGNAVVALLEHEDRQAEQAQLPRLVTDGIDVLLAAVAHEDDGIETALAPLLAGVAQESRDLGTSRQATHRAHQAGELAAFGGPAAHLEFVEAAIEGETDVEPAQRVGRDEHLALDGAGMVPGRLAAGRRIHGEQKPAARPGRAIGRQLADLLHESVHGAVAARGRKLAIFSHVAPDSGWIWCAPPRRNRGTHLTPCGA
ncbi:MAG: hypothetical protein NTV97_23145 [Alphaproteobacteria bacterium]|nr:hypothetical protein [Alphaproteobacteria bacterium]